MSEGICADCSSPDPSWASINHGVLVCDECCSVHRSLGRHISFVRSLHSTSWPPALREMVSTLVRKGSNSIWEHALHDSSSKVKLKKPSPRDKLHPNKHDFIIAKYKHLALLPRATLKESATMNEDLSKQLHASVRTSNLETCLRLLSLGADPNYLHLDRGNTPVHVAAHAGQAMQVELLLVHGGNPTALDLLGHTPEECARIAGHHQLADRLIECQYELTDKLSLFVSGRKPMHSIGEHFLVPPGVSLTGSASDAKSKLQELTNEQFEDLAADVYDEVDRRECDSIWLTTQQLQNSVAFLPVNPALSSTRNQGRQKLATLDSNEFCQLVIDILLDTKVRQNLSLETGQRSGTIVPAVIGALPEHDYEDVPVEEEEGVAGAETTPPTEPGLKERRTRSKLTPPIESMYSVAESGGNIMTTPTNPRPLSYTSTGREDNYNRLHETKRVSNLQLSEQEEQQYAYTTVPSSDKREGPIPPPPLKPRPQTEYARLHSKGGGAGKSDGGGVARNEGGGASDTVSKVKFNVVMEQLRKVQHEKEELEAKNEVLTTKVAELQKQLNKVIEENSGLRRSSAESATPKTPTSPVPPPTIIEPAETSPLTTPPSNGHVIVPEDHPYAEISRKTKQPKPVPPAKPAVKKVVSLPPGGAIPPTTPPTHSGGATPTTMSPLPTGKSRQSLSSFESHSPSSPIPTGKTTPLEDSTFDEYPRSVATPPPPPPHRKSRLESQQTPPIPPPPAPASSGPTSLPSMDVIQLSIKETTQRIQVLLKAAQSQRQNEFASCSQAITATITKLTELFPKKTEPQEVYASIKELERACSHLQNECQNPSKEDLAYHTRLVMNGAYDVAKAARFLVTCMEKL